MQMSLDTDNSAPTSPPASPYDVLGVSEYLNEAVTLLTARLTELSIESHSEPETVEDVDDDLDGVDGMECGLDDNSDEDWMEAFYDLELDEQLHDIYQLSK